MLISSFYIVNALILLSGLLVFRKGSGERNFSLTLIQALLILPLLSIEYLYVASHWDFQAIQLILFSDTVFILIWFSLALRLGQATRSFIDDFRQHFMIEVLLGVIFLITSGYFIIHSSPVELAETRLDFRIYGVVYFLTVLILIAALYAAWRLEQFWRPLSSARRWEYKFLVVGCYLVCGALAWSSSYRLTYLTILPEHLQLLAILLLFGWAMMSYAVFHYRLLNRKIFVSRKVVYAFVVPSLLAGYLLGFGVISLIMRTFGLQMSFVLKWLFLVLGLVGVGLFAFSGKIRRRVQFFISTHFYINKYEYRDEWLALSYQLQGALSEAEVVDALQEVLTKSLYTTEIYIWLEGTGAGKDLKLISSPYPDMNYAHNIASDDLLVRYLSKHSYFHIEEKEPDRLWEEVKNQKESFITSLQLTLFAPLSIGSQLVGLVGLGPEFTGGKYGHDDFDLLTALGSQTASALLAVRMAEELAHTREQQAWHRLSAFVLHDIKNAATMLSLLLENASDHIHEPEFQKDMLELVGDSLTRMGRVEQRLHTLQDEINPNWHRIELGGFLHECSKLIAKKLPSLHITVHCPEQMWIKTDPKLLSSVLENLLLNSFESGGKTAFLKVRENSGEAGQAVIELLDNGPGIEPELLPDILFEPFKTSKKGGSGIGLWQVKRLVASLNGTISAGNIQNVGAEFTLKLPRTSVGNFYN
ncbi:MAG: XrtA/PEP-CTERM system histidine kinase PrsK [Desulforhopalus sp.]